MGFSRQEHYSGLGLTKGGGNFFIGLVAQTVKNLSGMQKTQIQSLGQEDLLEKGMASCLENPMNRGAWRATVHGVTKIQT